ncbi:MAG: glycosyltransferase family 2 protein [Usitatibacter sp.]
MPAAAPEVSILIPAYRARFFAEAFASARAQAHASFEIVVCDDSEEGAIEECVRAADDPRVRYSRNPARLGFEGNFTHCLEEARGALVKFLNDDDRLRPDCVARLAASFKDHPRVRLATSRRHVIDDAGTVRPDIPATSPLAFVSSVMDGVELGDVVLMNGLNLIGEPSTVMFRRADIEREAGGLFTWNGVSYHCLADLCLWLRLLAKGEAFYCAWPLSEYRMHAGQEQREAGIECITERYDLCVQARASGFLREASQYRAALARVDALAVAWSRRPGTPASQRESLAALSRSIADAVGRI